MVCGSAGQGTKSHRTAPGSVYRLVPIVFLFSTAAAVGSPYPAPAAVYQCLDEAGKTVLSNRQSRLHHCQVISEDPAPPATPNAGMTPQGSTPPVTSETPLAQPYTPSVPTERPGDGRDSSVSELPVPNRTVPSSPSRLQPCSQGLNPLNPLNNPPCAGLDQPGAQPSGTVPVPSQ